MSVTNREFADLFYNNPEKENWNASLRSDFPGSSGGKGFAWSAGDPSLIPGQGKMPWRRGGGYPLQYPWASLVAQWVKNLPVIQETWVLSLGWEDPLEEGKATHSSILAWRIPMDKGTRLAAVQGVASSRTRLGDWAQHSLCSTNRSLLSWSIFVFP